MRNLWLVSWRNLTRNKKRFAFTLIAIVMGVVLTSSMLITNATTRDTFTYYEKLYAGNADFWVLSNDFTFAEQDVAEIADHPQIEEGLYVLDKQGYVELDGIQDPALTSVRFTGISSFESQLLELPELAGNVSQEGLILPEDAARLWDKQVGDTVTFEGLGPMEVTAIVEYTPWLRSPSSWEEAEERHFRVMVPLERLQESAGMEEKISYFRLKTEPGTDKEGLFAELQRELEGTSLFVQPVVIDDRQNNDVEGIYSVFFIVAALSLFISGFIIFNMIYASVLERRKEFSIMKSLGYTNVHIYRLVLMEILLLAAAGTIIGLPIGVWFGDLFQQLLLGIFQGRMTYTLQWQGPVVISLIVGLALPVAAACFPIYVAGKTPILQTLRSSQAKPVLGKHGRWVLGAALLAGGAIDHYIAYLFLLVGTVMLFPYFLKGITLLLSQVFSRLLRYPGKVAGRNLIQHLNRNANTSAMLASGICLALFLGAAIQSLPEGLEREIRDTFGGDLQARSELHWTPEELEAVASIEGVDKIGTYLEASPLSWLTSKGEYRNFSIMGFSERGDPAFPLFKQEEEWPTDLTGQEEGIILLGQRAFAEWGGGLQDELIIHSPAGRKALKVVGVVDTSHYNGYVGFVPEAQLEDSLNWPHTYQIMIKAKDPGSIDRIRSELWGRYGERLSAVTTVQGEIDSAQSAMPAMNDLLNGLLVLIICLSSIGIGNTLLMNTMERIREIGMIRAAGFTKNQVKAMIIGEGLLIGLTGVIIGLLLGIVVIYLNSISDAAGAYLNFIIPWSSVFLAVAAGILLSLLASWLPASAAVKINLQQALKYE